MEFNIMERVNPKFNLTPSRIRRDFGARDSSGSARSAAMRKWNACVEFSTVSSPPAGRAKGSQFDLAGTDEEGRAPVLPQIVNPVEFAPELGETEFRAAALQIARQLLGPEAEPWFEHAILKPAGYGAATPWHQDEAHRSDPASIMSKSAFGCRSRRQRPKTAAWSSSRKATWGKFSITALRGMIRRVMALECVGDLTRPKAVVCPLPAGGATVHHWRTLHHAGANTSSSRAGLISWCSGASDAESGVQGVQLEYGEEDGGAGAAGGLGKSRRTGGAGGERGGGARVAFATEGGPVIEVLTGGIFSRVRANAATAIGARRTRCSRRHFQTDQGTRCRRKWRLPVPDRALGLPRTRSRRRFHHRNHGGRWRIRRMRREMLSPRRGRLPSACRCSKN